MKSKLIKRAITLINMILGVISRPTGSNVCKVGNMRLYGYVYTITNTFTNSVYIGSSISQDKIEEIKQTYYRSKKFKLTIVYRTHSTTHKQRREVLSELKQTYYNIYNKNHIVMLI